MTEAEAYLALNNMERIGPVGVRALVADLGSAASIFEVDAARIRAVPGLSRDQAAAVLERRGDRSWAEEPARAEAMGARIVTFADDDYPEPLRAIHDPPLALYVRGAWRTRDRRSVAVVGTRHPTHYGRDAAERLSRELARCGVTVISGLAEGIDTAAHRGALEGGGRTVAVLGGGLDCLYPASNRELADRIADAGAVMTEYPFGRKPDRTTFPVRNRIVSGLSMGTLVVEAGLKSGAMITAAQALEQGRTVFAVPGRIDVAASSGPHDLIRHGAKLVERVGDVLDEFEWLSPAFAGTAGNGEAEGDRGAPLSEAESAILKRLEQGEAGVDALIRETGVAAASMNAVLIGLEMRRMIRMLPGRLVARASRGAGAAR